MERADVRSTPSIYELTRDSYAHPTWWRSVDNACSPHFHSALELSFVCGGGMDVLLDGCPLTVRAGELLIVPSYAVHRFATPHSSDTIVLVVPQDYIPSLRGRMAGKCFAQHILPAGEAAREIGRCLHLLLNWQDNVGEAYFVRGIIYMIFGILFQEIHLVDSVEQSTPLRIQDVLQYLHSEFRRPLALAQIAARFGYSPSRISHSFKKSVGCGIPEYVNTLRARYAAGMLLEHNASVTEAALEAGFESLRTFYRSFKGCFGVTPSQLVGLPHEELSHLIQNRGIYRE